MGLSANKPLKGPQHCNVIASICTLARRLYDH